MTPDHTVTLRDGPTISGHTIIFTDPAREAEYVKARRNGVLINAAVVMAHGCALLAAMLAALKHWGR